MITTDDAWLCYSVKWMVNDRWETPYVGVCPAASFASLPDANANDLFVQMITADQTIAINHHGAYPSQEAAEAIRTAIIATMPIQPHFNINGQTIAIVKRGTANRLRNCSTGEIYASNTEAAARLVVSQPNISRHLNGHQLTVAGVKLERIT